LYSSAFARLVEITQVVSPERGYVFHNRLTHSLKVAQVARTLAERFLRDFPSEVDALGGLDPDAAEAAGLAHDLGHPPFGHIAEEELNRLAKNAGLEDGFEGNAQSFRIVTTTSVSDAFSGDSEESVPVPGLNLTRSTLDGVLKYPWRHGKNPTKLEKWGAYETERAHFEWAHPAANGTKRSLIAEIMDWSDDVTYAIHDLLDFYRAGLIPLEAIKLGAGPSLERDVFLERAFARKPAWVATRTKYEASLDAVLALFPFQSTHRYVGADRDEQELYSFTTRLLTRFTSAITPAEGNVVDIDDEVRRQVDMLKEFVWAYVILNPDMAVTQIGQRAAVAAVFGHALDAAKEKRHQFFAEPFAARLSTCTDDAMCARLAADYVAGMTERELLRTHRRLAGLSH
jgi:dGTPase